MRKTVIIILAATFTAVAMAGNETRVYQFEFDGAGGEVRVELDSETMGFGLDELQPGDVRTVVAADGSVVTLSRDEDTLNLDVNGETFELPAPPPAPHMRHARMGHHHAIMAHGLHDGLTILSGEPLDESRQTAIRDALAAAGVTDELRFVSPGPGAPFGKVVIEKQVEDDGTGERTVIKHIVTR